MIISKIVWVLLKGKPKIIAHGLVNPLMSNTFLLKSKVGCVDINWLTMHLFTYIVPNVLVLDGPQIAGTKPKMNKTQICA